MFGKQVTEAIEVQARTNVYCFHFGERRGNRVQDR